MAHFDALVIGFGKAGKTLAGDIAGRGKKVAVIEKDPTMYGGTCINIACIPTKLLSHDALAGRDYAGAVSRKDETVAKLRDKNYHNLADSENITVYDAHAEFQNDREVRITMHDGSTETLTADQIFINTGAENAMPPVEGDVDSDKVHNSTTMIDERELPERLVIVGGGYIGLEFATMYNAFGSDVSVIVPDDRILGREDADIAGEIQKTMTDSGISFLFGEYAERLDDVSESDIKVTLSSGETVTADGVLMATGRKPLVSGLGLENTSVKLTDDGAIKVDDHLQTDAAGIWALGDVKGGYQFTYTSLDDYRIVRSKMFGDGSYTYDSRTNVHYTMFVDPPYSRVGLTADEAKDEGYEVAEGSVPMAEHPRSHVNGELRGLFKAVVDKGSGKILGAHLFGVNSEELVNMVKMAMDYDIPYTALRDQMYNHPVMSEVFNTLFDM